MDGYCLTFTTKLVRTQFQYPAVNWSTLTVVSHEQRCFTELTSFSAVQFDSENMKNISAGQCCFRLDQV